MNPLTQTLYIIALFVLSVMSLIPLNALACGGSDDPGLEGEVRLSSDIPETLLATPEGVVLKVSFYNYRSEQPASYDDAMFHEFKVRVVTRNSSPDSNQPLTEVEGTLGPAEGVEHSYLLWRPASPLIEGEEYYLVVNVDNMINVEDFTIDDLGYLAVPLSVMVAPEESAPNVDQLSLFEEVGDPVRDCCYNNCIPTTCDDEFTCEGICWTTGYTYSTRYQLGWSNPNQVRHGRSIYQLSIDGVVKKSAPPWVTTMLWEGDLSDTQEGITCFQLSALNLFTGQMLDAEERCMELSEVRRIERRDVSASEPSESKHIISGSELLYCTEADEASESDGERGCVQVADPQGVMLLLLVMVALLRIRSSNIDI